MTRSGEIAMTPRPEPVRHSPGWIGCGHPTTGSYGPLMFAPPLPPTGPNDRYVARWTGSGSAPFSRSSLSRTAEPMLLLGGVASLFIASTHASLLGDDPVTQRADRRRRDLDDVADLQPEILAFLRRVGRRARPASSRDHVARQEREVAAQVFEELGVAEDHVAGLVMLAKLAVHACLDDDAGGMPADEDARSDQRAAIEGLPTVDCP